MVGIYRRSVRGQKCYLFIDNDFSRKNKFAEFKDKCEVTEDKVSGERYREKMTSFGL